MELSTLNIPELHEATQVALRKNDLEAYAIAMLHMRDILQIRNNLSTPQQILNRSNDEYDLLINAYKADGCLIMGFSVELKPEIECKHRVGVIDAWHNSEHTWVEWRPYDKKGNKIGKVITFKVEDFDYNTVAEK